MYFFMRSLPLYLWFTFLIITSTSAIDPEDNGFLLSNEIVVLLQNYTMIAIDNTKIITQKCRDALSTAFSNEYYWYTYKLYKDSSHNINEIGNYNDCITSIYTVPFNQKQTTSSITSNLTYLLFEMPKSVADATNKYLFGLCLPKGCNTKEYYSIWKEFNSITNFTDVSILATINVYDTFYDRTWGKNNWIWIGLIPLFLLWIILIFEIFPNIPRIIFKCCFKKGGVVASDTQSHNEISSANLTNWCDNRESLIENTTIWGESRYNSQMKRGYDVNSLTKLKKCFKWKDNLNEILASDISWHESKINNDSGIGFVKGMKGVSIVLFIIGKTFLSIYSSPLKDEYDNNYFNTVPLSILFFINRFSGPMWISLSALSLSYKLLCYWDNEAEKIEIKEEETKLGCVFNKKNNNNSSQNTLGITNIDNTRLTINPMVNNDNWNNDWTTFMIQTDLWNCEELCSKVSWKVILVFFFRQSYKYVFYVFIILIGKYAFYDIMSFTLKKGPWWEYLKQSFIDKANVSEILSHVFLYFSFVVPKSVESFTSNFSPFYIVILEFNYYIIGVFLISISYKHNYRLDRWLVILFIIVLILRWIVYIGSWLILGRFQYIYFIHPFIPSKDFLDSTWNFMRNNPIYNYTYFVTGSFFGLVNYSIQKDGKYSTKACLKIPREWIKFLSENLQILKLIAFTFIAALFLIFNALSYIILFNFLKVSDDSLANFFFNNIAVNLFYLIDIDCFIVLLYLAIIPYFLVGENVVVSFFGHNYWNVISRPYFLYILLINGLINGIWYQLESTIRLSVTNVILYSVINIMLGTVLCAAWYTWFEMPLKKLNKFFLSRTNRIRKKSDE